MRIEYKDLKMGGRFSLIDNLVICIKTPVFFLMGGPYNAVTENYMGPTYDEPYNHPIFVTDNTEIEKL